MAFAHLHTHTEYSLLDGSNKIRDYVARVKELGMDACAITDHGVMYGVIDFYEAAQEAGVKPIIGCEVYVAPGSRFDREKTDGEDRYYHLILLAENNVGYANLMKIVSRSFTEGYYYKPRVDLELLKEHHEGLIALSACLAGEVAKAIVAGNIGEAEAAALRYRDIFGEGNFFLEMQDHGYPEQRQVITALASMSRKLGIPLVATNDCHYTLAEDAEAHDILLCIQTGKKLSDEVRMRYPGGQFYVKSEEEMRSLFSYAPEALDNTARIAERCNVTIEFGKTKLPHYEVPSGYDSWTYLVKLCRDGMARRYPEHLESDAQDPLWERLRYELETIRTMGYVDYFLIVWDYINFCRENDILVGPGRGSAAGSIVSYCLGITNIDPIRYQLLFERFLNPERVSMPDIDVDFEFERRQEVIDYVTRKYGREQVVQIITFGTLAAKGVLRDVGRVMDMPYSAVDQIAKMIPGELGITLERALQMNPELRSLYESDPQIKRLIDMGMRLEGLPRHSSIHAAGVVICSEPAEDLVPLSRAADGSITTQFPMTTIEHLGLLKMDFLGLRTLTVIQNAVRLANRSLRERGPLSPRAFTDVDGDSVPYIDIDRIDMEDPAVYASIGSGHTEGIFQLESAGMQSFMKELRPGSLEDVIAGIALYRPGPMDFIPQYIEGKQHPESIHYTTPELEPILSATYGCIVYQEQVMQIVRDLAGYSLGRSDILRRAMSKKKQDVMERERKSFIYGSEGEGAAPGCVARGIPEEAAGHIYDTMLDFAKYAFNKSHAACYAVVTYETAWLRVYYPVEFMAALMTSVLDFPSKLAGYILTSRNMGIRILPPDINEGESGFSVTQEKGEAKASIRYALTAIKGVGRQVIDEIVAERHVGGPFRDFQDFLRRCAGEKGKELNRRVLESLIRAGAFDSLGNTRMQLMQGYPQLLDELQSAHRHDLAGQMTLFDLAPEEAKSGFTVKLPDVGEFPREMLLALEKEVLGVYVSGHPLEDEEALWKSRVTRHASDLMRDEETGEAAAADGENATLGGIVTGRTIKYTKNDKVMAFLTLEDLTGTVEVIVFPRDYEKYSSLLMEDAKLFIRGRVSLEEEKDGKLIAERITSFAQEKERGESRPPRHTGPMLWLRFGNRLQYDSDRADLEAILAEHRGTGAMTIYIQHPKAMKRLEGENGIDGSPVLMEKLKARFGPENVVYKE